MSRVTCYCDSLPLDSDALGPFLTEDEAVRAVADRLLATVSQYIDSANRILDPWAVANSVEFNRDFDAGAWEGDFDALPDYRATLGWSERDCEELFRNEFEAFFMGAAVAFKTAEHGLNRHKNAAEQPGGTA
jgi:hypothetical protein